MTPKQCASKFKLMFCLHQVFKGHDKSPSIYFKEESRRQKQDGAITQQISVQFSYSVQSGTINLKKKKKMVVGQMTNYFSFKMFIAPKMLNIEAEHVEC